MNSTPFDAEAVVAGVIANLADRRRRALAKHPDQHHESDIPAGVMSAVTPSVIPSVEGDDREVDSSTAAMSVVTPSVMASVEGDDWGFDDEMTEADEDDAMDVDEDCSSVGGGGGVESHGSSAGEEGDDEMETEDEEDEKMEETDEDEEEDMTETEEEEEEEEEEDEDDEDDDRGTQYIHPYWAGDDDEETHDPDAYDPHDPYWPPPWSEGWTNDDRHEEVLFHKLIYKIQYYLGGEIPPYVRCPICTTTQLSIRGLMLYEPDDPTDLPDLAQGVVLICGHMFCKPCWDQTVAQHEARFADDEDDDAPPLACPTCRAELYHPGCGCDIPALRMPIHPEDPRAPKEYREQWTRWYRYCDDEWAWGWPQTLNEGGKVADVCKDCSRRR